MLFFYHEIWGCLINHEIWVFTSMETMFFQIRSNIYGNIYGNKIYRNYWFSHGFLQCFYIYGNNIDFKMFPSTNPMKIDEAIARRISKARRPFQRRIRRFPLRRLGRKCDSPGTTFWWFPCCSNNATAIAWWLFTYNIYIILLLYI